MWIKAVHRCKALCYCGGLVLAVLVTLWMCAQAVPVAVDKTKVATDTDPQDHLDPEADRQDTTGLHYDRYLKEVVEFLEKDKHFREKLQNSDMDAVKQGLLAKELDFVGHHVRTQLDELKRQEVSRLRTLIKVKHDVEGGVDKAMDHKALMKQFEYLNHKNPHTFEVDDLDRLIRSATSDLENYDKERHDDFKKYEMMKEHQRREKLKNMDEEHRKNEEMHYEEMKKKHAQHPKINHPGSQDQLKEVWQETDHLDPQDFDPKTFFQLHDTNGDGFFDEQEMESLFTKELEKMYDPKSEDYDIIEMEEERMRMREHVMKEVDTNNDRLVSRDEFMAASQKKDFTEQEPWETLDDEAAYTEEELKEYEAHLAQEESQLQGKTAELQKQHDELQQQQALLDEQKKELQQAYQDMENKKKADENAQNPPGVKEPGAPAIAGSSLPMSPDHHQPNAPVSVHS